MDASDLVARLVGLVFGGPVAFGERHEPQSPIKHGSGSGTHVLVLRDGPRARTD